MVDLSVYSDFGDAVSGVLGFLERRIPFSLWMATRVDAGYQAVYRCRDSRYGLTPETVLNWPDSMCQKMVAGICPRVVPDVNGAGFSATLGTAEQIPVGSYMGVPIIRYDGQLFGTLCAADPGPKPNSIAMELTLVELLAGLLSSLLAADYRATEHAREARHARIEASIDSLTGLCNRRGWDELLALEQERCKCHATPACVIAIDLNDLKQINDSAGHSTGDELIRRTANALRKSVRRQDVVARVGGDEFAILSVECGSNAAQSLLFRLQHALSEERISASLGMALHSPLVTLDKTWQAADAAMYASKRQRNG